ncbi:MAG TPA: ROK family protein [Chthoniobacterales bacterium]|nr:ROK family protein [Chthoniobacterales bacterium]
MKRILVIDIGGSKVKAMMSRTERRKFESGTEMTPNVFAERLPPLLEGWKFDAVAIGFPAPVQGGQIMVDPKNLGSGWAGFDFRKVLSKPVRVINDAAMQALGSYHGGRMLFLGLGTGIGSTVIWKNNVLSLELGDLPNVNHESLEEFLGKDGLDKLGKKTWRKEVDEVVRRLKVAFIADYVVLGGGNAKLLKKLPDGVERGHNRNAYLGGTRLWQNDARTRHAKWHFI